MTEALKQAIFDAGLGWSRGSGVVVAAQADLGYVAQDNLAANADVANQAGLAPSTYAAALALSIGDPTANPKVTPDQAALRTILDTGRSMRAALASYGIAWICPNAMITVWRTGVRAVTEVSTGVTTQVYFAQSAIYGATYAVMAQALSELIGNPTADPVDLPNSTLFDLIMSG